MKRLLSIAAVTTLLVATTAMADDQPVQTSTVFSKYKLTIGGYVKLDYVYNSNQQQPNNYFNLLTPDNGGISSGNDGSNSTMGVEQTRLWFKIDGPGIFGGKSSALVEGDFFGVPNVVVSSPDFRLRQAYGTLDWANGQILFGQTWEPFGVMLANTVDMRTGEGYGTPWQREPMLRGTFDQKLDSDNKISYLVAAVMPQQNGDNSALLANSAFAGTLGSNWSTLGYLGATQAPVTTNLPNFEGQVAFKSKSLGYAPGYLGGMKELNATAFGLYGHARYDYSGLGGKMVGEDSWGGGLYAFVPVLGSKDIKNRANTASFEGQIYEASNVVWDGATAAPFTQVGAGQIYGNSEDAAHGVTPMKDFGIAAQLMYYPTQELGLTFGFIDRIAANKASDFSTVGSYDKTDGMTYVNVAYDLNAAVRVAAEYQNVLTTYASGTGAAAGKGIDNIGRFSMYYFF